MDFGGLRASRLLRFVSHAVMTGFLRGICRVAAGVRVSIVRFVASAAGDVRVRDAIVLDDGG